LHVACGVMYRCDFLHLYILLISTARGPACNMTQLRVGLPTI